MYLLLKYRTEWYAGMITTGGYVQSKNLERCGIRLQTEEDNEKPIVIAGYSGSSQKAIHTSRVYLYNFTAKPTSSINYIVYLFYLMTMSV
jgi:hypothetical protein